MKEYQKEQYGKSCNVHIPYETELGVDFDELGEEQDISVIVARNVNTLVREANANMNRTKAQVANHFGVADILYIQPSGSSGVSHVGIFDSVSTTGNITAIEGNMSGQSGSWNNTSTVRRGSYNYNTGDGGNWGRIIAFEATTRI